MTIYEELLKEKQEIREEVAELEKEIYGHYLSLLEPPSLERN